MADRKLRRIKDGVISTIEMNMDAGVEEHLKNVYFSLLPWLNDDGDGYIFKLEEEASSIYVLDEFSNMEIHF